MTRILEQFQVKLANLREDARRWGWARTLLLRAMTHLLRLAGMHIDRVGLRPLVKHPPDPKLPVRITLRVLEAEDLLSAAADPELDMSVEFVRGALARGDMAFGAFEDDRLVGYSWRTFSAVPHCGDLWARVDQPYHFGYKAFTRASHRGMRIHAAVALFSDAYLLERGYIAEVGFVDITNFSSLGVAKHLGRQRIGYTGYAKWFGRYLTFRTPAVRKIGAELFEPGRYAKPQGQPVPVAEG